MKEDWVYMCVCVCVRVLFCVTIEPCRWLIKSKSRWCQQCCLLKLSHSIVPILIPLLLLPTFQESFPQDQDDISTEEFPEDESCESENDEQDEDVSDEEEDSSNPDNSDDESDVTDEEHPSGPSKKFLLDVDDDLDQHPQFSKQARIDAILEAAAASKDKKGNPVLRSATAALDEAAQTITRMRSDASPRDKKWENHHHTHECFFNLNYCFFVLVFCQELSSQPAPTMTWMPCDACWSKETAWMMQPMMVTHCYHSLVQLDTTSSLKFFLQCQRKSKIADRRTTVHLSWKLLPRVTLRLSSFSLDTVRMSMHNRRLETRHSCMPALVDMLRL